MTYNPRHIGWRFSGDSHENTEQASEWQWRPNSPLELLLRRIADKTDVRRVSRENSVGSEFDLVPVEFDSSGAALRLTPSRQVETAMGWIARNRLAFLGRWVAIDPFGKLVADSADLKTLRSKLRSYDTATLIVEKVTPSRAC